MVDNIRSNYVFSIKPRVKVPKEVSVDEIVEIKTLIRHPMHSGRMKDADGQTIPRQIINSLVLSLMEKRFSNGS